MATTESPELASLRIAAASLAESIKVRAGNARHSTADFNLVTSMEQARLDEINARIAVLEPKSPAPQKTETTPTL